jgi:hypothetical protein
MLSFDLMLHSAVKRYVIKKINEANFKPLQSYATPLLLASLAVDLAIVAGIGLMVMKGAYDAVGPITQVLIEHVENTSQLQTPVKVERQMRVAQFESMVSDAMKQLKDENAQLKLDNQQLTNKFNQVKTFNATDASVFCGLHWQDPAASTSSTSSNVTWHCKQLQILLQKNAK